MEQREVVVGIGAAPADISLDLGELHPSGHGALRIRCRLDADGVVQQAEPQPGLLHRGTEKLLEVRDYRQGLMLANRHDWLGAVTSEVTMALAAEELLGLQVPPRATWLRTCLGEVNRVMAALAHLIGAASLPRSRAGAGDIPGTLPGARARSDLQRCLEQVSGGRMHAMITRIGGVAADLPDGWTDGLRSALARVRAELPDLRAAVHAAVPEGLAPLTRQQAIGFGASGPVARASGLDLDVRRDAPNLAYPDLADVVVVAGATTGDARSRYDVLADQADADIAVIEACLERMPAGDVRIALPKVVRAPEGEAYARCESATGVNGVFLVSTGGTTPWRVRLRTASYANVQAMAGALPGTPLTDLPAAVGSFMFIAGDVDH